MGFPGQIRQTGVGCSDCDARAGAGTGAGHGPAGPGRPGGAVVGCRWRDQCPSRRCQAAVTVVGSQCPAASAAAAADSEAAGPNPWVALAAACAGPAVSYATVAAAGRQWSRQLDLVPLGLVTRRLLN